MRSKSRRNPWLIIPGFTSGYHLRLGQEIKRQKKEAAARRSTGNDQYVTRSEYFKGRKRKSGQTRAQKRRTVDAWLAEMFR